MLDYTQINDLLILISKWAALTDTGLMKFQNLLGFPLNFTQNKVKGILLKCIFLIFDFLIFDFLRAVLGQLRGLFLNGHLNLSDG